jgi:hypothetical protein
MTLAIHLVWSAVRRSRVAGVRDMIVAVLLQLLNTAGWGLVLARNLSARLVADRWQLDRSTSLLVARSRAIVGRALAIGGNCSSSGAFFVSLSLILLLLLSSLPLLPDFLELCNE